MKMRHSLTVLGLVAVLAGAALAADVKLGPYGGNGGNTSFSEKCAFEGRIVEVFGRAGGRLDRIGFRWEKANGSVVTEGPWGGTGGNVFKATTPSEERLVEVRVRFGGKVDAIELKYSNGATKGPYGGTGGTWSPWMQLGGHDVVGFHGKVGDEVDKLGVWVRPKAPTAKFGATPKSGTAPLKVEFANQSSGVVDSYAWSFGDGKTSTAKDPTHTYAAGTYTVKLTVAGPGGTSTLKKTGYISVNHPKPVAKFSATPTGGVAPLTVTFSNTSSHATSWSWTFGDGGTSTKKNPTYVFGAPGEYDVSLKATGAGGSDTEVKNGYVVVDSCAMNVVPSGCPTTSLLGVDDYDHQNQVHKFGFTVIGAAPGDPLFMLVGGSAVASLPNSSCWLLVAPTWVDSRTSVGFVDTFTYPIAASLLPPNFQFTVQAIRIGANQKLDASNALVVGC